VEPLSRNMRGDHATVSTSANETYIPPIRLSFTLPRQRSGGKT
jgi:hypothetical protein